MPATATQTAQKPTPKQQQTPGQAQLIRLFTQDAQHLLRPVDTDDIIACLSQHQRQIPGAAAKVGQNAVPDAVSL